MPSTLINHAASQFGAYSPPKLKIYGDVKALTASGISGVQENGVTNCVADASRRPC